MDIEYPTHNPQDPREERPKFEVHNTVVCAVCAVCCMLHARHNARHIGLGVRLVNE